MQSETGDLLFSTWGGPSVQHGHDEYERTDIGLARGEPIVERHGGDVRVESEPDEGTTFGTRSPGDGCPR